MSDRVMIFSQRNLKELMRDPLSYIFCIGFPVVMLIVMTAVNESIPPQAGMTVFQIQNLSGGIAVFGLSFVMLFTCMTVSKDRSGAFLRRLYASPLKGAEYVSGYTLPVMVIAAVQTVITAAASVVIGIFQDYTFDFVGLICGMLMLIPIAVMFIGLGLLFGTIFNEKAAPGLCSIIISLAAFLGGEWMDIEAMGGTIKKICDILPFYNGVKAMRFCVAGEFSEAVTPLLITAVYAAAVFVLAAVCFSKKMKSDIR
ncbi:MAG: ABC transporter permease [Oscillospiraceae bacterium]|nr:ABC transporter permease [Oscillospiraceae bacterium]